MELSSNSHTSMFDVSDASRHGATNIYGCHQPVPPPQQVCRYLFRGLLPAPAVCGGKSVCNGVHTVPPLCGEVRSSKSHFAERCGAGTAKSSC